MNKAAGLTDTFAGMLRDGTGGGSLGLTKAGPGALVLTGSNTYTGPTAVSGGTLQGKRASLPRNISRGQRRQRDYQPSTVWLVTKVISGAGSVTKIGAGTLALSVPQELTRGATVVKAAR